MENRDWASVQKMIELEVGRLIGRRRDYFMMAQVARRDETNNVLWVKPVAPVPGFQTATPIELDLQPIPFFAFDYEVIYYDTVAYGTPYFDKNRTVKKFAKVRPLLPQIGETVLICREYGVDRLPRCLGVLRSMNYVLDDDEEVA